MSSAKNDQIETTTNTKSSSTFIRRFTIRRVRLGAIIFALFVVIESAAQSLGIVKAYPNLEQRAKVINTLASNSALGLFYGNKNNNIVSPAGYMVYRILPILCLIGAIWMVMFINKMLRGQEEDGRWEMFISGQASAKSATLKTIIGAFTGIALAYIIIALLLLATGKNNQLDFSSSGSLVYSLAAVYGAVVSLGIGAITSQLAATKRKANIYGILVIVGFFLLRSVGNTVNSLAWIKNLTPFGWIDKIQPYYHTQVVWLLPLSLFAFICCWYAIRLSGKRDMGESIIEDSGVAKPNFKLLTTQLGFNFRANRFVLGGWLAMSVAIAGLVAVLDKTVAKSLTSTGSLAKTFSNLTGNPSAHIEVAYLGAGAYLIVTILMVMVAAGLGSVREEESSNRLENFISGIVSRQRWLSMRLLLLTASAVGITFLSNLILWVVVEAQGIHLGAGTLLFGGFSILGPVILLLGFGVLSFGIKPRITSIAMYVIIAWSFTIDIVSSVIKTSKFLADTSLLHYISLVPAASPDWMSFTVMTAAGLTLVLIGINIFRKRDLILE